MPFPLLLQLFFTLPALTSAAITLPGCLNRCGDLPIPFPFGTQPDCHLPGFLITCNSSFSPPRAFINRGNLRITSISLSGGTTTVLGTVARECYARQALAPRINHAWIDVTNLPYAFSHARNKFTVLGCGTIALNSRLSQNSQLDYTTGCVSFCNDLNSVINGSCSGIGCCQTAIPLGLQRVDTVLQIVNNNTNTWSFSPCGYAFLIDAEEYVFKVSDLGDFYKRDRVPVVLDWAVGNGETCESAATTSSFLCGGNSYCINSTNVAGYRCSCLNGYDGNPYLADGCQDINECEDLDANPCTVMCENTPGSYICSCPNGYTGDGMKSGSGCSKRTAKFPLVQVVAGSGLGLLLLLVGGFFVYWIAKKRRLMQLREKFFRQNGGILLQQELAAHEGLAESSARIFTAEELKRATDNYADSRILGHGGNGTVFKGVLPDTGRVVAIKKSHLVENLQVEQFINEVVLLSRIIHKNVVRILGCCLETQVPLLVYEYISNGTLHYHIHGRPGSLSWEARLRIAAETAAALAYIHSAIARPIFHRDVKAANILLTDNYMAKVSDFGASRLIPLDRAQITTLVQGTLGYLDPEYFHTGQLTEKSDVYSFGVVLAEIMTGQKPLSRDRPQTEKNLSIYFLVNMKEGKLHDILEPRVKNEGSREQLEAVAEVVKRCLRIKSDERPAMSEVAAEIERLRRPERNARDVAAAVTEVNEEERSLLAGRRDEESESTRFYSDRHARVPSSARGTTYFDSSYSGDESLDQHILMALEMQR